MIRPKEKIHRTAYSIFRECVPLEKAERIERGVAALERDAVLLGEKGKELIHRMHWLLTNAGQLPLDELEHVTHELTDQFPSFENPRLELYRQPDLSPLLHAMEKGIESFVFEISQGCENQCLYCVTGTRAKMFFMPLPMFRLLADSIRRMGGKLTFITARTEIMLYRDVLFGADFADLFLSIKDIYSRGFCDVTSLRTGAWPKDHRFALAAAHKMNAAGQRVDRLSISLLHEDLNLPAPPQELLDEYAERFATAISLLRPKRVFLRGFYWGWGEPCPTWCPSHFEQEEIKEFFREKIITAIPPEFREIYARPIKMEFDGDQEEDGDVIVTNVHTRGYNWSRARFPVCNCERAPDTVMIIYHDGTYSLQEKEKFPRETGSLF